MVNPAVRRGAALLAALVVAVGLIVQLHATATSSTGYFHTTTERVLNVFCFFTILSNLLFGVTSAVLAINPDRDTPVFSGLRLSGVLSMVVTGVVFHIALRGLHDLHGSAAVADALLHSVSPILALLTWLLVGPRGSISKPVIWLSIVYPVGWLIATLIRGAAIGFYPYPFLDAATHGYLKVTVNCVIVAVLFLGLAFGAAALDRKLPATSAVTPTT